MNLKNKRILLSQHRLVDFTGSEIITLEMAEYFSSKGAKVFIVTDNYSDPIKSHFEKIKGLKVYDDFFSSELDEEMKANPPDIAWIHHQIIIPALFTSKALKKTRFIFNHMSSFYFQEFPLARGVEVSLADLILFNSESTMEVFNRDKLLDGVAAERMQLLNNAAPSDYHLKRQKKNADLKSILLVSNHIPEEVHVALETLKSRGISITVAGVSHKGKTEYNRITPEHLSNADVVVTIGKTVQYSLTMGVPVYCYDHFGGPGYLSDDNYGLALYHNFSGRGFTSKDSTLIAEEILIGYEKALKDALLLQKKYSKLFNLDSVMNRLLSIIDKPTNKVISKTDETLFSHYFALLDKLFKSERLLEETRLAQLVQKEEYEKKVKEISAEVEHLKLASQKRLHKLVAKIYKLERMVKQKK